ncbi:hypothetical protein [Chitinasiproducens palmae]|uniref:Uncharacterized protein n=1 Tax=Chitinasiproducens palmae TaxID=1770053 RepID=A0A1H2PQV0_9BURK|nr:hypothetical protein [Chitinasiproducens palmae]SDV49193.1 hypothetical protein SAMN05216551_107142 [Chitinasiproducens palmae]
MPKYRALERGQIAVEDATPVKRQDATGRRVVHRIVEPGEIFDFNGEPGTWMERVKGDEKGQRPPKASGATAPKDSTSSDSSGEQDGSGAP